MCSTTSGRLRELKNKGNDRLVIPKSGRVRLPIRELLITARTGQPPNTLLLPDFYICWQYPVPSAWKDWLVTTVSIIVLHAWTVINKPALLVLRNCFSKLGYAFVIGWVACWLCGYFETPLHRKGLAWPCFFLPSRLVSSVEHELTLGSIAIASKKISNNLWSL